MIEIVDLHKSFDGLHVLKGINLTIPKGKVTVIIGGSGSGKTVMLRHIIGLLYPDRGRVLVDGVNIHTLDREELSDFRKRFGMLFQNAALFDSLDVFQNVAFPLIEHRKMRDLAAIRKIVDEKLKLVGLKDISQKMPSDLSGGMRKRVGLARAIALDPEIILYDEPTTGLDPVMTVAIDNLILSMQQRLGVTTVVISHDVESTFRIADQVAMIVDGRIVVCGSPEEVKKSQVPEVHRFLSARNEALTRGAGA
jgi:phospholipid/cholesterol/gamma-HCH transport system ATP-binding protein